MKEKNVFHVLRVDDGCMTIEKEDGCLSTMEMKNIMDKAGNLYIMSLIIMLYILLVASLIFLIYEGDFGAACFLGVVLFTSTMMVGFCFLYPLFAKKRLLKKKGKCRNSTLFV